MKFTVTPAAVKQIQKIQPEIGSILRISVQGGGCSGFQYAMQWSEGPQPPIDKLFVIGDRYLTKIAIDPISAMYLDGTELDYVINLMSQGFAFNNPQVKTTCGCGKSFGA